MTRQQPSTLSGWMLLAMMALALAGCGSKDHSGPGRVHDATQGFSIVPPTGYTAKPGMLGAFMFFFGTPEDGFAPNLNVVAEPDNGVVMEQIGSQIKPLLAKAMTSYKPIDEGFVTIDGKKCYWISGQFVQGTKTVQNLQYLVPGKGKLFTLTFTAPVDTFATHRAAFEASALTARTD